MATEKIVVFAPIASASEIAAIAVKPGLFRRIRAPYRRSAHSSSHQRSPSEPRISSLLVSVEPIAMRARRRSFRGRKAGADQILRQIFKMAGELRLHLIFQTVAADNRAKPRARL